MKHYHFSIIIERDKDGYFVSCPQLQGCYTQGRTYEEALKNIEDAIKLHLKDRMADREILPDGKSVSLSTIDVAV